MTLDKTRLSSLAGRLEKERRKPADLIAQFGAIYGYEAYRDANAGIISIDDFERLVKAHEELKRKELAEFANAVRVAQHGKDDVFRDYIRRLTNG